MARRWPVVTASMLTQLPEYVLPPLAKAARPASFVSRNGWSRCGAGLERCADWFDIEPTLVLPIIPVNDLSRQGVDHAPAHGPSP